MNLTDEQQSILRGASGPVPAKLMRTLVEYGDAFGAGRLVPIKSGHLAGTFGVFAYKSYYQVLDQIASAGLKVLVPTTCNPRPGQDLHFINRRVFSSQAGLDAKFATMGVTPNYSCVCYDSANVPAQGDVLAWAESSAVQFANSVLGARTNRNSVLIDLAAAITGFTPEFGYLLDENRRGKLLIKLNIKNMDAPALGYLLGRRVVNRVPVIEHYPFSRVELKNMGGAMAASGAVALFHVEGLTPEAPDLQTAFDGPPPETMEITQADLDSLRMKDPARADLVAFGCPQMTLDEAVALAPAFAGKRVKKPTWFFMVPQARERFQAMPEGRAVLEAGVVLHDFCPLAALTVQLRRKRVLTNSGKLFYYLAGSEFGSQADCLRAGGV
jgi:cis-L-3-hydroxyproline dehydratase